MSIHVLYHAHACIHTQEQAQNYMRIWIDAVCVHAYTHKIKRRRMGGYCVFSHSKDYSPLHNQICRHSRIAKVCDFCFPNWDGFAFSSKSLLVLESVKTMLAGEQRVSIRSLTPWTIESWRWGGILRRCYAFSVHLGLFGGKEDIQKNYLTQDHQFIISLNTFSSLTSCF